MSVLNLLTILLSFSLISRSISDDSLSESQPGTIITPLKNKQNSGYYLEVRAGNPNSNNIFEMLLDISTPWTWFPDTDCFNCFRTNLVSKSYDCDYNRESCFQDQKNGIKTLRYPFGFVYAFNGYDRISFSGLPDKIFINHTVSFALEVTQNFYNIHADGFIGLGLDSTAKPGQAPNLVSIIDKMHEQGLIKSKTFSLFLTNNLEGEDSESQIVFGGYNPSKICPGQSFQVSPLTMETSWSVKLNQFKIGNLDTGISPINVLLSTTFPDIGVPQKDLNKIVETLQSHGVSCTSTNLYPNHICSCPNNDLSIFPDIEFELENSTLRVPSSVYISILGMDLSDKDITIFKKQSNCVLRFTNIDHGGEQRKRNLHWIFGRNILSFYHTMFDMENKNVQFAVANSSTIAERFSVTLIVWMIALVAGFLIISASLLIYKCISFKKMFTMEQAGLKDSVYNDF